MINDAISPDESMFGLPFVQTAEKITRWLESPPMCHVLEAIIREEKRNRPKVCFSFAAVDHTLEKIEIRVEKVMFSLSRSFSPRYSDATMIRPRTRDKEKCLSPRRRRMIKEKRNCARPEKKVHPGSYTIIHSFSFYEQCQFHLRLSRRTRTDRRLSSDPIVMPCGLIQFP